ncbi:FAD binding domain protein [Arthrobacter crystallopoietes BAB-32]|uniref:FAD binding domain protein n=1 Tax=Arthrobacter crystallopoietes BAB-32 TaxID=1246476 RepID=N1URE5_9MICC|nr:NAD(P)/FAD-dependent oxidoreductase [Arthrobacter crystallopoietes]EMY32996.1 FAD binding domain protein [Arthrobacter crystallopoietes BAB-32]
MSEHSYSRTDVIVIGAGVAGLSAACSLREAGLDVLVLEARDRIGGRILTLREGATRPVELGAEFLHTAQNPLLEIFEDAGTATVGVGGTRTLPEGFDAQLAATLDSLAAPDRAQPASNYLAAISSEDDRALMTEAFEAQTGRESLRRTSAADAIKELHLELEHGEFMSTYNSRVPEGLDLITTFLAEDLPLQISTRVERIVRTDNGVSVIASAGGAVQIFDASRVVVTLPLGVLKNNDVQFEPPLPDDKVQAIHETISLDIVKVLFVFDGDVWPLDEEFKHTDDDIVSALWHSTYGGAPGGETVVVAWAVGDEARQLMSLRAPDVLPEMLGRVRKHLGNTALNPTFATYHSWLSDPYARGAYSHLPPGASPDARLRLAQAIDGRVFWAGEATAEWRPRTVHGAYLSGMRAAAEILAEEPARLVSN